MNWQAISAVIGACVFCAGVITGLLKLGRDHGALTRTVEGHTEQIAEIIDGKASNADFVKLAALVSNIEQMMLSHHADTDAHRNKDFERLIDQLVKGLDKLVEQNSQEHKAILDRINVRTA